MFSQPEAYSETWKKKKKKKKKKITVNINYSKFTQLNFQAFDTRLWGYFFKKRKCAEKRTRVIIFQLSR